MKMEIVQQETDPLGSVIPNTTGTPPLTPSAHCPSRGRRFFLPMSPQVPSPSRSSGQAAAGHAGSGWSLELGLSGGRKLEKTALYWPECGQMTEVPSGLDQVQVPARNRQGVSELQAGEAREAGDTDSLLDQTSGSSEELPNMASSFRAISVSPRNSKHLAVSPARIAALNV